MYRVVIQDKDGAELTDYGFFESYEGAKEYAKIHQFDISNQTDKITVVETLSHRPLSKDAKVICCFNTFVPNSDSDDIWIDDPNRSWCLSIEDSENSKYELTDKDLSSAYVQNGPEKDITSNIEIRFPVSKKILTDGDFTKTRELLYTTAKRLLTKAVEKKSVIEVEDFKLES